MVTTTYQKFSLISLALLQWGQGGPWPPHLCPVLVQFLSFAIPVARILAMLWPPHLFTASNAPASYLKDTTEFLKLIETTKLPQKCILASIDIIHQHPT